jgi:hypothetical protein
MSVLLDDGELPSGYFFSGPTATPVGGSTGILPANGAIVPLATYPGLAYLNTNIGYLPGPVFTPMAGAPGFSVLQSSGPGGEELYSFSYVFGPYAVMCGSNNVPNTTTGIGASLSVSSDMQNWTLSQINTIPGTACAAVAKSGNTYYALVMGVPGQSQDYIYSSANLTSWSLAYTYAGGGPTFDPSQMAATGAIVASLQGGCSNLVFFNGTEWVFDTNNIAANGCPPTLNVLTTGEIGGITLTSTGNNTSFAFSAWKIGPGATATTTHQVEAAFTGSLLCPLSSGLSYNAPSNPWNCKLTYVGSNYVATICGIIYTSPDFVHWTKQGDKQFVAIENIGGTLYAISIFNGVNQYLSSPDGINWTPYYTSAFNQGYIPANCGARILPISANVWAVCSSVLDQEMFNLGGVYGQQGSWVSFVFNPTGIPLVMQSNDGVSSSVCTFAVNPAGNGILAGNCNLVPAYNPTVSVQMPNLTSSAGVGTAMFMKI